jgi:murein DD-endopeptidase MepM/ murein hydrolase activator NlpD
VTVLKLAAGVATVALASMLAATYGVVSHTVDLSRSQRLEKTNQALSSEVATLGQRVGALSDTLAVISRRDDEVRLVAGLDPLSPEVRRAGIGGPSGAWPERERLISDGGVVGREALGVHVDLDALIRRANVLATSFREASDSLSAHA